MLPWAKASTWLRWIKKYRAGASAVCSGPHTNSQLNAASADAEGSSVVCFPKVPLLLCVMQSERERGEQGKTAVRCTQLYEWKQDGTERDKRWMEKDRKTSICTRCKHRVRSLTETARVQSSITSIQIGSEKKSYAMFIATKKRLSSLYILLLLHPYAHICPSVQYTCISHSLWLQRDLATCQTFAVWTRRQTQTVPIRMLASLVCAVKRVIWLILAKGHGEGFTVAALLLHYSVFFSLWIFKAALFAERTSQSKSFMSCGLPERIHLLCFLLGFLPPFFFHLSPSLHHLVDVPANWTSVTSYGAFSRKGWVCALFFFFFRQLLAPGYQEVWYTPVGSRQTSFPANTVSMWDGFDVVKLERGFEDDGWRDKAIKYA